MGQKLFNGQLDFLDFKKTTCPLINFWPIYALMYMEKQLNFFYVKFKCFCTHPLGFMWNAFKFNFYSTDFKSSASCICVGAGHEDIVYFYVCITVGDSVNGLTT